MTRLPSNIPPQDDDLAAQARPGHGVPSQDPNTSAQFALTEAESQRETASVVTGSVMAAGAATGATVGGMVAGPVGVMVGAGVGAVVGALGGTAATLIAEDTSSAPSAFGPSPAPWPPSDPMAAPVSTPTPSVHLHIEDTGGDGRAVLLIHGWPLSGQAWQAQVPVLQAAGYRVVTYDRRGFGRSDKPDSDYSYNTLADDLRQVILERGLQQVTLVGFSMGGGEVARYIERYGESRVHSVVFAAAVPPCLMQSPGNPEGPLTPEKAHASRQALEQDREAFFDTFTHNFFSANGVLQVSEEARQEAVALCRQSAQHAALACMDAFHTTDFREDLKKLTVPTLVIHGDADAIVPIAGSGERTHHAVPHSQMVRVTGAPHGLNVSHAQAFNEALLQFLKL